jgi:hypothetical protein
MIAMRRSPTLVACLLALSACGGTAPGVASASDLRAQSWQEQITEPDRKRLAGLWSAWTRALNQASGAGAASKLAAAGPMAVADAPTTGTPPPPGDYQCRTLKLGVRSDAPATAPALAMADPVPCRISAKGSLLWFEQLAGPQRVGGTLYPDDDRLVFLGSKSLAGEMRVMAYASDAARDQVGVLRALGPGRWRLELPWPNWQSNLEVIEIVAG